MTASDPREPSCHHDPHQPASMCIVCRDDGRVAAWKTYWDQRRAEKRLADRLKVELDALRDWPAGTDTQLVAGSLVKLAVAENWRLIEGGP